jgi:hypothetical protein
MIRWQVCCTILDTVTSGDLGLVQIDRCLQGMNDLFSSLATSQFVPHRTLHITAHKAPSCRLDLANDLVHDPRFVTSIRIHVLVQSGRNQGTKLLVADLFVNKVMYVPWSGVRAKSSWTCASYNSQQSLHTHTGESNNANYHYRTVSKRHLASSTENISVIDSRRLISGGILDGQGRLGGRVDHWFVHSVGCFAPKVVVASLVID